MTHLDGRPFYTPTRRNSCPQHNNAASSAKTTNEHRLVSFVSRLCLNRDSDEGSYFEHPSTQTANQHKAGAWLHFNAPIACNPFHSPATRQRRAHLSHDGPMRNSSAFQVLTRTAAHCLVELSTRFGSKRFKRGSFDKTTLQPTHRQSQQFRRHRSGKRPTDATTLPLGHPHATKWLLIHQQTLTGFIGRHQTAHF